MAESSLWTCFLEASIKDMLPMAYADARTKKNYFCNFFLAIPFFTNQETSEMILMEWLFLHKMVSYKRHISIWDAGWLAAFAFSCQLATIEKLTLPSQ
jgi:hypothetical protein